MIAVSAERESDRQGTLTTQTAVVLQLGSCCIVNGNHPAVQISPVGRPPLEWKPVGGCEVAPSIFTNIAGTMRKPLTRVPVLSVKCLPGIRWHRSFLEPSRSRNLLSHHELLVTAKPSSTV